MTAQILAAELGNLIQDSKRKNTELRTASEKSLQDLKSLPNTIFSAETQRHDVQLKILQALPSLLQNYATDIWGDHLSTVLQICSSLQNAKNPAVSSTAAATLQQLVITVFDRVAAEDERALEIPIVTEVKGDDGLVPVRPAANDAYKLFNDLVLLVVGEKPLFMRLSPIPPASLLELVEAVLSNHGPIMTSHVEQVHIVRTLLMPLIIRSLSDRLSFPVTVRIMRILNLVIRNHLDILPSECEIALGLLNHMLDPEASPLWKRVICLEIFRGIYADPRLLLLVYSHFDAFEGKKAIFGDNLASFVRLAVEKPTLIGLGQQSTVPTYTEDGKTVSSDQAVAEAGALAGVIGGLVAESANSNRSPGISSQWSTLKTACLDHLDKSDPPSMPDTYIYSLVLTCITNISESLAKFVLPLTVHHENKGRRKKPEDPVALEAGDADPESGSRKLSRTQSFRKKTIPVNPLDLTDHSAYPYIQASSSLVNDCWPAVLATCSTFLNAALDTEYYRALVRAIQKFTQVSGLLRLSTPRDAFLTTLGKAAVPSNLMIASISSPKASAPEKTGIFANPKGLLSVDSLVSQASSMSADKNRRQSHDVSLPALGPRNLLCLRALLNLAIALGPTLQSAWSIVFETLQIADLVMAFSGQTGRAQSASALRTDPEAALEKMEAETSAVQAAARRLFESTVDYPNESFTEVLNALCALLNPASSVETGQKVAPAPGRPQILHQRRMGSVSGISLSTEANSRDAAFALNKIGELAALNEARLSQYEPAESGWDTLIEQIVRFSSDGRNAVPARLLAADILSRTVKDIAEFSATDEQREDIQARILLALQAQISALKHRNTINEEASGDTDTRVHQIALEALKGVIEQCGDSLVAGWGAVFDSLMSVFVAQAADPPSRHAPADSDDSSPKEGPRAIRVISRSLARSAFATVHLVCSDFMSAVPDARLSTLLELLSRFTRQQQDLNMSLTAITFFWNVSDFLQPRNDLSELPSMVGEAQKMRYVQVDLSPSSRDGSIPSLWLQLLLHLSSVTTDVRTEVRNSATQTIQRIFESSFDQFSADVWLLCLRTILFGMVEANIAVQHRSRTDMMDNERLTGWNETTKTVLQTVGILFTAHMDRLTPSQLGKAWSELLGHLREYFGCASHTLALSVFTTITGVLSHIDDMRAMGMYPLLETADIWNNYFDHRESWSATHEDNQDAFVAYATTFEAIYKLAGQTLVSRVPSMLDNLEMCIVDSDQIAYSSDVDHMTPLQTKVIGCLAMINTKDSDLPSPLIRLLSRLAILPYTTHAKDPQKQGPTFVALAKSAMALLRDIIAKHIDQETIYSDGSVLLALQSLARPIHEKYSWHREGKIPTLWQKATSTALAVLKIALPLVNTHTENTSSLKDTWVTIVALSHDVTRAQLSSLEFIPPSIGKDEAFDIEAFAELRDLITLSLGSVSIPDALRRSYTRNLFSTSLIHTPLPGELPDLTGAPLEDLYKLRYGQTAELELTWRSDLSYACLSELFSLVAIHDGSSARIKLAQAAAPYLILRAALPLKTYIADDPLRGRVPQPESERRELLFVLRELGKLRSEPHAIPDAPGVRSKHRKHLHRLYPLLNKASRVARQDHEIFEHIAALMDMVGDEFGLDDD
ncbi:hypothetical protein EK21DRAFT_66151 [Setomelanomma holmii]|uniref:Protein MON2 homolog n=1 Tax=Setomelanomma holmii TaxID=210430 RepID=A0A9P4H8L7_9PLEO|nr:hypothetical protein EK21DRAFT_66151 [Setomelanomma holmii]